MICVGSWWHCYKDILPWGLSRNLKRSCSPLVWRALAFCYKNIETEQSFTTNNSNPCLLLQKYCNRTLFYQKQPKPVPSDTKMLYMDTYSAKCAGSKDCWCDEALSCYLSTLTCCLFCVACCSISFLINFLLPGIQARNILIDENGVVKLGDLGISASIPDMGDLRQPRNDFEGTRYWCAVFTSHPCGWSVSFVGFHKWWVCLGCL